MHGHMNVKRTNQVCK